MSLFAKVQQAGLVTQEKDVLGGTLQTNVYDAKIKVAYLGAAASGAINVTLEAELTVNGKPRNYRETMYISNRAGSFTYKSKDGTDEPLPGYALFDSICKAAIGKSLHELTPELKMVRIKADAQPEQREVFMELLGQPIKLGISEETVDKTAKNDSTGKYEPTGETRDENVISKAFDADGLTSLEREAGKTEPEFMNSWIAKLAGKKVNKAKGKTVTAGKVAGSATANAGAALNMFG